ncbi:S-methyl-5'-thioinosine phosphorylase [Rehaibacterium terrae]|jgi:5'-methylthioinosine phosphorylase|uniref:Probable 6-oxopurine nucleoside phosphorylase n=1 Tax=Rehaibacterium terrae TaxID=1341696 RepID=A0A7W7V714_9GAMM|nr:S-methyl-5'-thioinosine phosphorylase [Rehaibacterium terrae]MBB5014373.1 5'-methylthioinosine phosphorylase [Rehaibacterium terrae]
MTDIALAVIGGTGLYKLAALENVDSFERDTPYGAASGPVRIGDFAGRRIAFLARHGEGHSVPPHRINYRANLWLLKEAGARRVLAVNAVGGITERWGPRTLGVPDQLIDYTWGRVSTLCEEPGSEVLHVDFTEPYTPALRRAVLKAGAAAGITLVDGGCYGVTQGPRLETRAEVARLRRDGCDLVGMTGMPEAALARELGLDYACLALVANWAAGCGDQTEITLDEVFANLEHATAPIPRLLEHLLAD